MPFDRYRFTKENINSKIYKGIKNNTISYKIKISESGKRLDNYALEEYGDSTYWWIIASASGISWPLQLIPGIILYIPTNLDQIEALKF